jgi:hypothetical protein
MNQIKTRAYSGAADLNLLIEFARKAAKARWPQFTYKQVGDVVWSGYGLEHSENVRLWFDAGDLVAYACFEPPMSLEFDLMPGLARYDPVGREIFEWGES